MCIRFGKKIVHGMSYKQIRDYLRDIWWLRRIHQFYWTYVVESFRLLWVALYVRPIVVARYDKHLRRISKKFGKEKVKVLFLVSNLAKWKCQTVFDEMSCSELYDPTIGLMAMDIERRLTREEKRRHFEEMQRYFGSRGMPCVLAYDIEHDKPMALETFSPDIVWYQMPGVGSQIIAPEEVSRFALSCYVPYFVQNYGALEMDCGQYFHRMLWRHFTLNEEWANAFMQFQGRFFRVGNVVGCGHPMLDLIESETSSAEADHKLVIYAPHWSCGIGENYSTFLRNGQKILELAKNTQQIRWVFKPHPTLRHVLLENKFMNKDSVDAYYSAWEQFGDVCYGGDYTHIFQESSAMITDCGSFLTEYGCLGKPIIHLISSNCLYKPHPISARLFDTYYQAHDWDEFMRHFNQVIINGNDYRRKERLSMLETMCLRSTKAAKNIIKYLDNIFSVA